jgi:hypothetical protein
MRIRQIKPDYWRDSRLHNTRGITADVREFYVGLWGVADDAGFLRWDVSEIAAELYRYRTVITRERQVNTWSGRLVEIGRVVLMDCEHAYLPNLTKHQKIGGNRSEHIWRQHQRCLPGQVHTSSDESISSPTVGEGKGKERNGKVSDFDDALARARMKAGGKSA